MDEATVIAAGKALWDRLAEDERKRRQRRREWKCVNSDGGRSSLGHRITYTRMVRR